MKIFIPLLMFCAFALAQQKPQPAADMILTNAKVWTVDKAQPTAEALAIIGDRIVAVGTADEVDRWRGAKTRVIDIQGRLLLPGFNMLTCIS